MTSRRAAGAALLAGIAAVAAQRALAGRPPGGAERWRRTNFAGRDVDLLGGPAAAAGAVAAAVAGGRPGTVAAVTAAGALGLYDDLVGETHARGLRGHLAALREGRVTTGLVKMVGLAAAGTLVSDGRRRSVPAAASVRVLDAALVSGAANLLNLLDLRPGRALKVTVAAAVPLAATPEAGGALATAAVLLPGDLGERHMLGDCGANALGALLGAALVGYARPVTRAAALGGVVALTLLSEKVSFSAVIERTPLLAAVDGWGRRPA